jgi:hypothetical protein
MAVGDVSVIAPEKLQASAAAVRKTIVSSNERTWFLLCFILNLLVSIGYLLKTGVWSFASVSLNSNPETLGGTPLLRLIAAFYAGFTTLLHPFYVEGDFLLCEIFHT